MACGGSQKRAEIVKVCEAGLKLAQFCYDATDATVACDKLQGYVVEEMDKAIIEDGGTPTPEFRNFVSTLCKKGCEVKKSGQPWSTVGDVDCKEVAKEM